MSQPEIAPLAYFAVAVEDADPDIPVLNEAESVVRDSAIVATSENARLSLAEFSLRRGSVLEFAWKLCSVQTSSMNPEFGLYASLRKGGYQIDDFD